MNKKVLFITGTRADFGKLKPLLRVVEATPGFETTIFATGMHTLARYGLTAEEIYKAGFKNIHVYMNQIHGEPMDLILANTISGLSRYVREVKPDMIVVHGDRIEALAGATVGCINNILVAHIEGGEVSGTVDELIRHAVSKLSHLHFVANQEAADRLINMGEHPCKVFVIGSPDIDIMLSDNLPSWLEVQARYEIPFKDYAIVLFHPVTTERKDMLRQTQELVAAIEKSKLHYIIIYPNNDDGSETIFHAYQSLKCNRNIRFYPSLRFEYFLVLLKNAQFILGNSSVGIREAPVYGVPSINIGTRQNNRFQHESILDVDSNQQDILSAISRAVVMKRQKTCLYFGCGRSAEQFIAALKGEKLWSTPKQKQFYE